jgi:hypothetical protein
MESQNSIMKNLKLSYFNKLYLLKSDPSSHLKTILKSESEKDGCFTICKVFIPTTYLKPNSYNSQINNIKIELDLEIFEKVDHKKFNFTKKDKKETLMAIIENQIIINEEEILERTFCSEFNMDLIVSNIFPLTNYHLLILPFFCNIYPQYLDNCMFLHRIFNFQLILNEEDMV